MWAPEHGNLFCTTEGEYLTQLIHRHQMHRQETVSRLNEESTQIKRGNAVGAITHWVLVKWLFSNNLYCVPSSFCKHFDCHALPPPHHISTPTACPSTTIYHLPRLLSPMENTASCFAALKHRRIWHNCWQKDSLNLREWGKYWWPCIHGESHCAAFHCTG